MIRGISMRKAEKRQFHNSSNQKNKVYNKLIRRLLIIAGTFFVGIGIIGIFIPLLPTTPFLLLAAVCYARSSKRFYNWLLNNRWFGIYIKNYLERKGVPLKVKIQTISILWIIIITSCVIISNLLVWIILVLIAIGVTIHVLTIRTFKKKNKIGDAAKRHLNVESDTAHENRMELKGTQP